MVRNTQSVVTVLGKNAEPEVRIGQFAVNALIDANSTVANGVIRNSQSLVKVLGSAASPTVRVTQFSMNMLISNGFAYTPAECDIIVSGEATVITENYSYSCLDCEIFIDTLPNNCALVKASYNYITENGEVPINDDMIVMSGEAGIFACYFYESNDGCNPGAGC